jgi:sterol desaturase/sphingolipid hydroxylase (fatty acid hydroxylase superfamily)
MNIEVLAQFSSNFDDGIFLIAIAILSIEIVKGLFSKSMHRTTFFDMFANVSTQLPFVIIEVVLFSGIYVSYSVIGDSFVTWTIPTTTLTALLIVLVADLTYYGEHRFAHEVRIFWTQHAVHHSSRFMNITVAVRFGPFEGLLSALFHLPLVLIGFSAELVLFGILIVQAYQTWIHTELIGKLGVIDRILNTPSNHRVHHGCDEKYIDKNYGGILIIWDRLFGTYQQEDETPKYGLARDFDSTNPLQVWFSELPRLFSDIAGASSLHELQIVLFGKSGEAIVATSNEPRETEAGKKC